jgi:hypothetical protein
MVGASLLVAGTFAVGLGLVHLIIPRLFDFEHAIGVDGPGIGPLRRWTVAGRTYQVRRRDALGLSWVMSNAASYVLMSIGLIDLAWLGGWRGLPIVGGSLWIAGWWAIRSGSQLAVGRRPLDLAFVAWFGILAGLHVAIGFGWLTL